MVVGGCPSIEAPVRDEEPTLDGWVQLSANHSLQAGGSGIPSSACNLRLPQSRHTSYRADALTGAHRHRPPASTGQRRDGRSTGGATSCHCATSSRAHHAQLAGAGSAIWLETFCLKPRARRAVWHAFSGQLVALECFATKPSTLKVENPCPQPIHLLRQSCY
jgi:hypothetical protein